MLKECPKVLGGTGEKGRNRSFTNVCPTPSSRYIGANLGNILRFRILMQIDLDVVSDRIQFESKVCIVGAGIAGLLLARHLASHGINVHLVEAGGRTLEARSQEMYNVRMVGRQHDGATEGRFRVFGGSSTRWGGQLLPYTPDIFTPPAGTPSVAWPLTTADVEPFYAAVQDVMQISQGSRDAELPKSVGTEQARDCADINIRFSKWAPFSKRNLANTIGPECLRSDLITVFLHANVTCIEVNKASGRVELVVAKNYSGKTYRFRAAHFVICAGTIESCRILLASGPSLEPCIGNTMDNVGRYFHDHISVAAATVTGNARRGIVELFTPIIIKGTLHTPKLEASVALRSSHQLLAVMAHFAIEEPEGSGIVAVRDFLQIIQRRPGLKPMVQAGLALPRNSAEIARLLWFKHVRKRRAISGRALITLRLDSEQSSNAESRVKLSDQCDALGMPRAALDWRISEAEHRTIQLYAKVVDRFLNRLGVGPISWNPDLWKPDDSWLKLTRDTYHPMGGTRMGTEPASSVVNPNLQVHGISNLFVASCSVFPSGGSSNPTFTLMTLALRLGERLTKLCES